MWKLRLNTLHGFGMDTLTYLLLIKVHFMPVIYSVINFDACWHIPTINTLRNSFIVQAHVSVLQI